VTVFVRSFVKVHELWHFIFECSKCNLCLICPMFRALIGCIKFIKRINKCTWIYVYNFIT